MNDLMNQDPKNLSSLTDTGSNPQSIAGRMEQADYGEGGAMLNTADRVELAKTVAVADVFTGGLFSSLKNLTAFAIASLGILTVTVEVFTRHRFGERYLTAVRVILGFLTMGTLGMFFTLSDAIGQRFSPLGGILYFLTTFAVVIVAMIHSKKIRERNAEGKLWYSHSFGLTNFQWLIGRTLPLFGTITEWSIYRTLEPLGVFIMGAIFGLIPFLRLFGFWLMVTAVMMFIRNNAAYQQQRSLQLDAVDSRIVSGLITPIMQGMEPAKTMGYAGVPMSQAEVKAIADTTPPSITPNMMKAEAKRTMNGIGASASG